MVKIDENNRVQSALPNTVFKLFSMLPLFSPRITPNIKNITKEIVAPTVTSRIKAIGRSVKSPILSRLREKRYPIIVRISAHFPKGESEEGEKSRTIPAIKPKEIAPNRSSRAMSPKTTQRYSENPAIGKFILDIAAS